MAGTDAPARRRRAAQRGALAALSLAAGLGGAEALVRRDPSLLSTDARTLASYRAWRCDGTVAGFAPHPYFQVTRAGSEHETNSLGFHGGEWPLERSPGVPRVLCLGGSTTEGGNPDGVRGSYPDRLREALERELGQSVEVLNAGISGWTTAETLMCWSLLAQDYAPDLVILHDAVNDVEPRFFEGFRADYSHSHRAARVEPAAWPLRPLLRHSALVAALLAREEPPTLGNLLEDPARVGRGGAPPAPPDAFRRNVLSLVRAIRASGADVMLLTMPASPTDPPGQDNAGWRAGIAEHNAILRRIARDEGCLLADAEARFAEHSEDAQPWFLDLVHVTITGNLAKSTVVYLELMALGWLERWR